MYAPLTPVETIGFKEHDHIGGHRHDPTAVGQQPSVEVQAGHRCLAGPLASFRLHRPSGGGESDDKDRGAAGDVLGMDTRGDRSQSECEFDRNTNKTVSIWGWRGAGESGYDGGFQYGRSSNAKPLEMLRTFHGGPEEP